MKEIKLFDYQEDMKERIEESLRLHRSVMVQMPTGTGKTVLLASVVEAFLREHPGRSVWIVAHRRELVSQIKETLKKFLLNFNSSIINPYLFTFKKDNSSNHPVPLSKEGSTFSPSPSSSGSGGVAGDAIALPEFLYRQRSLCPQGADDDSLTQQSCDCLCGVNRLASGDASGGDVADKTMPVKAVSIQWLSKHYDEIDEEPGLIVIDEAHHALATTYKIMWERFPQAKFLGLTATPCRLNGKGFTDLFDVLVQSWNVPEFIGKGRLASYDFVSIKTDGFTQRLIDSLQKRGADGDYQNKEMDRLLNKRPSIERLYQSFADFAKDRKGIVYAINISHAQNITEFYREHGVNAVAIDAKTPAAERVADIEAFKKGDIQVLVNVDIFSEGFDCPDVEFVQLARPTLSLAKYLQMVGRGLRVAKGKKNCVIIDNVGLYRVFGLPSQIWNWEAMFLGTEKVRRKRETAKERDFFLINQKQEKIQKQHDRPDSEMMMVMRHEDLLQSLQYREFVDSKGDFAIIKLPDGKMTVVNRMGEQVLEPGNYHDMKLLRGNILAYRPRRKTMSYYDLLAKTYIDEDSCDKDAPRVITMKGWEFIEYDGIFMSRTTEDFSLPFRPSKYDLFAYSFYLLYEYRQPTDSGCQVWSYDEGDGKLHLDWEDSETVCLLRGDHTHVYWLCASLYGNKIVVMDSKEDYYLVDSNLKKTYIGSNHPKDKKEDLRYVMPLIAKQCSDEVVSKVKEKELKELKRLHEKVNAGDVELYQAGKKWGIKVDGKIVVPPIYLHISQPVGAYCAFEQIPRHWGVMTLKGKILVEANYEKVDVLADGKAIVYTITGKTQTINLNG